MAQTEKYGRIQSVGERAYIILCYINETMKMVNRQTEIAYLLDISKYNTITLCVRE